MNNLETIFNNLELEYLNEIEHTWTDDGYHSDDKLIESNAYRKLLEVLLAYKFPQYLEFDDPLFSYKNFTYLNGENGILTKVLQELMRKYGWKFHDELAIQNNFENELLLEDIQCLPPELIDMLYDSELNDVLENEPNNDRINELYESLKQQPFILKCYSNKKVSLIRKAFTQELICAEELPGFEENLSFFSDIFLQMPYATNRMIINNEYIFCNVYYGIVDNYGNEIEYIDLEYYLDPRLANKMATLDVYLNKLISTYKLED